MGQLKKFVAYGRSNGPCSGIKSYMLPLHGIQFLKVKEKVNVLRYD